MQSSDRTLKEGSSDAMGKIVRTLGGIDVYDSKTIIDNVVCITNANGGAGASTIVTNLAYELSKDISVLVIDLDMMNPMQSLFLLDSDKDDDRSITEKMMDRVNILKKFEKEDEKSQKDLVDYLSGTCKLGEIIHTVGKYGVITAQDRNLSSILYCEERMPVENFEGLIKKVRDIYDLIIIDCPMRPDNMICNEALYLCDKIYFVWDEGLPSIVNTDRIITQLEFTGISCRNKSKIIMNKRTNLKYSKYPFEKLGIELVATLPFSTDILQSSLDGEIFCRKGNATHKNGSEFERQIEELGKTILREGGMERNEQ